MGLFKKFTDLFTKKSALAVGQYIGGGFARWMDRDAKVFADEGYRRNVIASRCIQIIAKSLASVDLNVMQNGEKLLAHPLIDLLNKPNPRTAGSTFFEHLTSFNRMAGNGYVEAVKDATGMPRELWIWTPYQMETIRGSTTPWPRAYVWKQGDFTKYWEIDKLDGTSDLLQWKTFHPFDVDFGMSPMEPAAYSIDQHNSSSEWNQALLQNGAKPDGMLTTGGNLSDDQYERLREQLDTVMAGPNNAGKPFIGEGGLKYDQFSLSPKDMDWLAGRKANAIDIASAYGVPVQLLGIEGSQTFANFEQARLSLWEDTVLGLLDELVDLLNMWLVPMYNDPNLEIVYDVNSIEALEFKRSETMAAAETLSYLSINEKRELAGFDRLDTEGADDIWMPAGLLPLGFDVETALAAAQPAAPAAPAPNSPSATEETDDEELDDEMDEEEAVKQLVKMGIKENVARLMVDVKSKN